jgi:hypothetical protein
MRAIYLIRNMQVLPAGQSSLVPHIHFVEEFKNFIDEILWWGDNQPNIDLKKPMPELVSEYKPDFVFKYGFRTVEEIDMGSVRVPKIIYLVDFFPPKGQYPGQANLVPYMKRCKYDLAIVSSTRCKEYLDELGVVGETILVPWGVNIDVVKNLSLQKTLDVCAIFTIRDDVYPLRTKLVQKIEEHGFSFARKTRQFVKYIEAINQSKVCVTSNNIFSSLSFKYTETMACGTLMLADHPEDMDLYGYKDGEHFVIWDGLDDLIDKIKYYISHETEREAIAKNAMEYVRAKFSTKAIVGQIIDIFWEKYL